MTARGKVTAWLEDLVSRSEFPEECITWPYSIDGNGYALYSTARTSEFPTNKATRYICFRVHGEPASKEHHAAHSCGKGHEACVNPGHLSWKTPGENLQDKIAHGTHMYGDAHPSTKFSDAVALAIRADKRPVPVICSAFGISDSQARKIRSGRAREWAIAS